MFCSADKKIYTTDIYLSSFPKKHYMVLRQEMQITQKVHKTINSPCIYQLHKVIRYSI